MGTLSDGLQVQTRIPGSLPNLFEVALFGEETATPGTGDIFFTDSYTKDSQPTRFYCTSYSLPPPNLVVKRNPVTKKHYINKYNIPDTVTITWQENATLDVWRYHQEWLRSFYRRESDVFVTSPTGKKRNAHILLQQYEDPSIAYSFEPSLTELLTVRLIGLIPQSIPPLSGDWNQDSSSTTALAIKYYVDYIAIVKGTGSDSFKGAQ